LLVKKLILREGSTEERGIPEKWSPYPSQTARTVPEEDGRKAIDCRTNKMSELSTARDPQRAGQRKRKDRTKKGKEEERRRSVPNCRDRLRTQRQEVRAAYPAAI
jgi:hypothetical protein